MQRLSRKITEEVAKEKAPLCKGSLSKINAPIFLDKLELVNQFLTPLDFLHRVRYIRIQSTHSIEHNIFFQVPAFLFSY